MSNQHEKPAFSKKSSGVILKDVTKIFQQPDTGKDFVAVNHIDLEIQDGEAVLVEVGDHTFFIPTPGKMEGVAENGPCCLTVRPESVHLSKEEGPLSGTVSRATYYGAKVEYEVMLGGQPIYCGGLQSPADRALL